LGRCTDWNLGRTIRTKSAFESIRQGLQEAIVHAKGDEHGVRLHRPVKST
jgi:hypothetical protein